MEFKCACQSLILTYLINSLAVNIVWKYCTFASAVGHLDGDVIDLTTLVLAAAELAMPRSQEKAKRAV